MRELPPKGPMRARYYGVRRKLERLWEKGRGADGEFVTDLVLGVGVTLKVGAGWWVGDEVQGVDSLRDAALLVLEISDARRGV